MSPNDKSTDKRNEDATKTIEEPIAEVTDQYAADVAGGSLTRPRLDVASHELTTLEP